MKTLIHIHSQHGSSLIISLVMLMVLTLLGVASLNATRIEEKITNNQKLVSLAFFSSDAGVQEIRERFKNLNQAGAPTTPWRQFIGDASKATTYFGYSNANANHNLSASNVVGSEYVVELRHKTEFDAQVQGHTVALSQYFDNDGSTAVTTAAAPGRVIYYGYANTGDTLPRYFTTAGASSALPVKIATAMGLYNGAIRKVEVEMVRNPGPPILGTIYSKDTITINGSSGNFSGVDRCASAASIAPVYTLTPAVTNLSGSPTFSGTPAAPATGPVNVDILGLIDQLRPGATILTTNQTGVTLGTAAAYRTFYANATVMTGGRIKLQNVTGYGTLLVHGELVLGGNVNWNGVILVDETITFNGGGNPINLYGAVFSQQSVDINGGLDLRYDSCNVRNALNALPVEMTRWSEIQ